MNRPIIFLGINSPYERAWSPSSLNVLRQVTGEFYPHFVITSKWPDRVADGAFDPFFRKIGLPEVADALHPVMPIAQQFFGRSRYAAITQWLFAMEYRGPFVVLDDPDSGDDLYDSWIKEQQRLVMCRLDIELLSDHLPAIRFALSA